MSTMLSLKELARLLGLHRNTIARMIQSGAIKAVRLGRSVRVRRDEAERLMARGAPLHH